MAVEEVHSILRQIVARTIESDDCKGLAQFTLLKREIATTAAASLESMKDDARKMVQTMVRLLSEVSPMLELGTGRSVQVIDEDISSFEEHLSHGKG